jgi:hypothetical protein
MKSRFRFLAVAPLLVVAGGAAAAALSKDLAPDVIEGTLAAAECIVTGDPLPVCNHRALSAGQPGGVLAGQQFTVLLIDGRILARTCVAAGSGRLRASGILHQSGGAMSLVRLEQNCGQGWHIVDVPHAGTLAEGAAGGDE